MISGDQRITEELVILAHFSCNYFSYTLRRDITVNVITPEDTEHSAEQSYIPSAPYPVLYFIHGGANDGTTIQRYTSIERYAQEHKIAVVLLSSENKYSRKLISVVGEYPGGPRQLTEDFGELITEELPRFVSAHFPISRERKDTYICGLSAGGYGTLINSLLHPEKYRAVGLFSPLLTSRSYLMSLSEEERKKEASVDEVQLRKNFLPEIQELLQLNVEKRLNMPDYYITSGLKEHGMIAYQNLLAQDLRSMHVNLTYRIDHPFGHEWAFWDLAVQDFLNWLPRTDVHSRKLAEGI